MNSFLDYRAYVLVPRQRFICDTVSLRLLLTWVICCVYLLFNVLACCSVLAAGLLPIGFSISLKCSVPGRGISGLLRVWLFFLLCRFN